MDLPEQFRMNITAENLPSNFENEIVESNDVVSIRCNLKSMDDINEWVKEFGNTTNTKWNSRKSCPSGERFVCWKRFVCHHSSFNKVPAIENKKGFSKNAECLASVRVKIKLNTTRTRMEDGFIKRGLAGIITIIPFHKHRLMTAETLRFLPAADCCREQFEGYFNDGMRPTEAAKYHRRILEMKSDFQPTHLLNNRINPYRRTIEYWYDKWRLHHLGPRNGHSRIEDVCETSTIERNNEFLDGMLPSTSESLHAATSHSLENKIETDKNSRKKELTEKLIKLFGDGLEKFDSTEQALEMAVMHLGKISSERQWETMLATLGSNVPLMKKAEVDIRVQPTSTAQKAVGVTKDSKWGTWSSILWASSFQETKT